MPDTKGDGTRRGRATPRRPTTGSPSRSPIRWFDDTLPYPLSGLFGPFKRTLTRLKRGLTAFNGRNTTHP